MTTELTQKEETLARAQIERVRERLPQDLRQHLHDDWVLRVPGCGDIDVVVDDGAIEYAVVYYEVAEVGGRYKPFPYTQRFRTLYSAIIAAAHYRDSLSEAQQKARELNAEAAERAGRVEDRADYGAVIDELRDIYELLQAIYGVLERMEEGK